MEIIPVSSFFPNFIHHPCRIDQNTVATCEDGRKTVSWMPKVGDTKHWAKKNAGRGGSGFALHGEKTARLHLGSLQMPKIWKGWSQWGRGKNTSAFPSPIQAFLHLGCRLLHTPKSLIQTDVLGCWDGILLFSCLQYHSSQYLTKLFQLKGQPLQKGATSAFRLLFGLLHRKVLHVHDSTYLLSAQKSHP